MLTRVLCLQSCELRLGLRQCFTNVLFAVNSFLSTIFSFFDCATLRDDVKVVRSYPNIRCACTLRFAVLNRT